MRRANLTAMELAILRHLANGMQSKEIAARVDRSCSTVESYIRDLFLKLEARSRVHLIARAFYTGALDTRDVVSSDRDDI